MGVGHIPVKGIRTLVKLQGTADANGDVNILIKVPGTVGEKGTRFIEGAYGYWSVANAGDWFTAQYTDEDNILGLGAGFVLNDFSDLGVPAANQGYFFRPGGDADMGALGDPMPLDAGFYIKITAKKGNGILGVGCVLYINLHWGKRPI